MNDKASKFQQFLDEKHPNIFQAEEIPDDKQQSVVFRSFISVKGQQLPVMFVIDNSVFSIIRVQIAAGVFEDSVAKKLFDYINEQNQSYKPFKLFFNQSGDLMLETCLLSSGDEVNGDDVYLLFDVIVGYLSENYRAMMKVIWSDSDNAE